MFKFCSETRRWCSDLVQHLVSVAKASWLTRRPGFEFRQESWTRFKFKFVYFVIVRDFKSVVWVLARVFPDFFRFRLGFFEGLPKS